MKKNILITGGCGFLATSLIPRLIEQGFTNIRLLDNFSVGTTEDLSLVTRFTVSTPGECTEHSGVVLVEGDICDTRCADLCCRDIGYIVHLAANTGVPNSVDQPHMDMKNNVIGTFNMLEAARKHHVSKFIFASSGAPAGTVEPPIHEELPPHPISPYGASKLAGEGYCSAYYHSYGIDTICLRFGNVYGPLSKRKSSVVAKFIRQAIEGVDCHIYGDGSQTRDFIYIDDLTKAILLSLTKNVGGETFQIASGKERTVSEIAILIKKILSDYSYTLKLEYDAPRLGDVKRNFSNTDKAKNILGWSAQMPIEEGIDQTVKYFVETLEGSA